MASVPDTPSLAPVSDATVTSTSVIKVTWQAVASDGGSDILSYSLEIDDGTGGDFTPIVGFVSDYLLTKFTTSSE